MDYVNKTTTFIAFINKTKKDKFWCNGNIIDDKDEPRIYPYESKEDKKNALEIGKRLGVWCETGDIEAIILKTSGKPFHIIDKTEAKEYEKVLEKDREVAQAKRRAFDAEEKRKAKEETVEVVEPPKPEIKQPKQKLPEPVVIPPVAPEVKKRGRPKKIFEE